MTNIRIDNVKEEKEVLLVLTDSWCDWEAGYAIAVINSFSEYEIKVKTIAMDKLPKVSMGGIRAAVDYDIRDYQNFDNLAMVILPGGLSWGKGNYDEIAGFVQRVADLHITVAAICGATIFLGKHGLLDHVKHTGDSLESLQSEQGYNGQELYVSAQVVVNQGFITANETAAVEFAYEIFKILKIDSDLAIDEWYDNFNNGAVR